MVLRGVNLERGSMSSIETQSDKRTAWSELTGASVASNFDFSTATLSEEPETPVKEPSTPTKPETKPDTTEPPAVPAPGPDEAPDGCPSEPGPCTW